MPTVSVIIPTYNRAEVLPRAIKSVLAQTYDDLELIVVDDASTDDTAAVVEQFDDNRVQYYCLDENSGANAARNKGVECSSGELISFLDSDDQLLNTHLEVVVKKISQLGDSVGGVYTSYDIIQNGKKTGIRLAKNKLTSPADVVADYKMGGFSCLTIRKNILKKVGKLDERFPACQDQEFLIRFLQHYEIHPITEVLLSYHKHGQQISTNPKQRLHAQNLLIETHGDIFDKYGESYINYARGFQYVYLNDMKTANQYFRQAVRAKPTNLLYWFQYLSSFSNKTIFSSLNVAKTKFKLHIITPAQKWISG